MSYYIGIDLGGTNTEIGILNPEGKILIKKSIKTDSKQGAENTFQRIWDTCKELIKNLSVSEQEIKGIGLGIPGPVLDNSIVKVAANFSWGNDFPAKKLMEEISGKLVVVENDVRAIALGEHLFGATQNYKNSMIIPIGTGIAAGIIIDGKVIQGKDGAAGEFGHIVMEENGLECGCGLSGCLETYCSATGIVREAKKRLEHNHQNELYKKLDGNLEKLEAKDIFEAANNGDLFSLEIVDFFCNYLAKGIGALINIINPEIIVFAGGVSKAGDILLRGTKKHLKKYALKTSLENIKFDFGKLQEEAGIKGAAALIMNQ